MRLPPSEWPNFGLAATKFLYWYIYIYIYIYIIIMKSEELKYYIYFHCFNFHVFTLRSLSEYRCDTNFYWRYTYYITVIDQ